MRQKRKEAPEWIFPWRGTRGSPVPKIAAFVIVLGMFAMLFAFFRIQVSTPTPWAAGKATLIRVLDDAEGRALTLRAREGGPFPSRFEPLELEGIRDRGESALSAVRWQPAPHEPALRELPEMRPGEPRFSSPGAAVLPRRRPPAAAAAVVKTNPQPVLYPLAGLTMNEMPGKLPDFTDEAPPAMTAEPWRFLLRVNPNGRVRDVVPLVGAAGAGHPPLTAWLRRVGFPPSDETAERWIAIGLGFTNQPVDGSHPD